MHMEARDVKEMSNQQVAAGLRAMDSEFFFCLVFFFLPCLPAARSVLLGEEAGCMGA